MFKYALIFFVLISFLIKSIFANVVNKIFIKGNQRIESNTILSYINIKKNKEISEEDLNSVFKDLFATELFSDISFDFNNNSLFIKVVENPIIKNNSVIISNSLKEPINTDEVNPKNIIGKNNLIKFF